MMRHRAGISSTEVVCATIVVAVVSATVVPALIFVGKQNRATSQRLNATAAVGNILDEMTAKPYNAVGSEAAAEVDLPDWLREQLSEPKLNVTVEENSEGKRISAELSWESVHGGLRENVRLHAWTFEMGDSA